MAISHFPIHLLLIVTAIFLILNLYFAPLNNICENQRQNFIFQLKTTKTCAKILSKIENISTVSKLTTNCPKFELIMNITKTQNCKKQKTNLDSQQVQKLLQDIKFEFLKQINTSVDATSVILIDKNEIINNIKITSENLQELGNITEKVEEIRNECEEHIDTPEMTMFLKDRNESREAVFFTETSGKGFIKARFVCALESAAIAYNNADIYLLFASVPKNGLIRSQNEALYQVLKHYSNIKALKINMKKLFLKSPLESFYKSNVLNSSRYYPAHLSDVIRSLVVWEFGGKYFDLDIITLRRLPYENFYIHQTPGNESYLANGAFGFKKGSIIGDYMFQVIIESFNGADWAYNGPRVLTEALSKYAGVDLTNYLIDAPRVKDFVHMPYNTLFPIEFFDLMMYFEAHRHQEVFDRLAKVKDLWGLHIGNNLIKNYNVQVGSQQAYGLLAEQYCPRSYWSCEDTF